MKSSKRNVIVSAITIIALCFSIMVGGTYAWFTSNTKNDVCVVESGKLKVKLEMWNGTDWEDAEGKTLRFLVNGEIPAEDQRVLWEPGCTYTLPKLRVVNDGNLALKFMVSINGIDGDEGLNKVITWTVDGINLNENVKLEAKKSDDDDATKYTKEFTLKGHMSIAAGNEYQELKLNGIGIMVKATQVEDEYDSFDNSYDAEADYNVEIADDADSLKKALTSDDLDGKTIKLADDVEIAGTDFVEIDNKNFTIDLNGSKLSASAMDKIPLQVTNSTVVIKDSSASGDGQLDSADSYPIISAVSSDVTIESGKFTSSYAKEGSSGYAKVIQVSNSNLTINGGYFENTDAVGSYHYIINVSNTSNGKVTINGGTFVSHKDFGYFVYGKGDVEINGGDFTSYGWNSYLANVEGDVVINDCNYRANNGHIVFSIAKNYKVTIKGGTYWVNEKAYSNPSLAGLIFHNKTTDYKGCSGDLLVDPAEGKEVKVNQLTNVLYIAEGATQSAEKDADGYYVIKKA